jgi:hypothetical protein
MSNRSLLNLMRGGMSDFHVGRGSARDDGPVRFAGERRDRVVTQYTFAAHAMHEDGKHDYSKKENREMKSKKRSKDDGGSTTGDESASDTEGPKKKKGSPIHAKGSDADGDGKTGEGKGKKMDWSDKNNNDIPDGIEKKKKK